MFVIQDYCVALHYDNNIFRASCKFKYYHSKTNLDKLESDLQDRVMTLEKHGGMNQREDRKRGNGQ